MPAPQEGVFALMVAANTCRSRRHLRHLVPAPGGQHDGPEAGSPRGFRSAAPHGRRGAADDLDEPAQDLGASLRYVGKAVQNMRAGNTAGEVDSADCMR